MRALSFAVALAIGTFFLLSDAYAAFKDVVLKCDAKANTDPHICTQCSVDPSVVFNKLRKGETVSFLCKHMRPGAPVAACWIGSITTGSGPEVPGASIRGEIGIQFELLSEAPYHFSNWVKEDKINWQSTIPPLPGSQQVPTDPGLKATVHVTLSLTSIETFIPNRGWLPDAQQLSPGGFFSIFEWPPKLSTCPQ